MSDHFSGFSLLEKDSKTFNILKMYIDCVKNKKNLFNVDCCIQLEEICIHNYLNHKDGSIEWGENYAKGERMYLNSIKLLSHDFIVNEIEINQENFEHHVDKFNELFYPILNNIY